MKVYYVAGEKSGDQLALWHVKKYWPLAIIKGIGGAALEQVGTLDFRYEQFSCLGSFSFLWSLPRLYFLLRKIVHFIFAFSPDFVVLVNFSQPNLWLAQMLKKRDPRIKIIFFSPPQLWIWGSWRIKKIKKYIDRVEVIFPFEVEWYQKRGVRAFYAGSPVLDRLLPALHQRNPTLKLLCMLGSREQELRRTLPLFFKTLSLFQQKNADFKIDLAVSDYSFIPFLLKAMKEYRLHKVTLLTTEQEILESMKTAALALAKPGTNTLELALMGIPTIVAFSVPWMTYQVARHIIRPAWLSLPNLLLKKELFQEFLQEQAEPSILATALQKVYDEVQYKKDDRFYTAAVELQKILQNGQ